MGCTTPVGSLAVRFASPAIRTGAVSLAACCVLSLSLVGCKTKPAPPSDSALTAELNSQLTSDPALAGTQISVAVNEGAAVLNGAVANDAQRTLAARDAAGIPGVTRVENDLTLAPPAATANAMQPATVPVMPTPAPSQPLVPQPRDRQPTPVSRAPEHLDHPSYDRGVPPPNQQAGYNPPPPIAQPAPLPPPLRPIFRNVSIPAGTTLPVRVTQTLDSATTQTGDSFSGVVASDVVVDGLVAIPQGSTISGHVDAVQEAAHFKGNALLTVSLVDVKDRGERIAVSSYPYTVTGKGRGKNTAEKAGGGAAVGAILGGIFGGGKGAAIGAAAGGGAGVGANAITRGQQVQIASETVVRFQTSSAVSVRVRSDAASSHDTGNTGDGGGLQPR